MIFPLRVTACSTSSTMSNFASLISSSRVSLLLLAGKVKCKTRSVLCGIEGSGSLLRKKLWNSSKTNFEKFNFEIPLRILPIHIRGRFRQTFLHRIFPQKNRSSISPTNKTTNFELKLLHFLPNLFAICQTLSSKKAPHILPAKKAESIYWWNRPQGSLFEVIWG